MTNSPTQYKLTPEQRQYLVAARRNTIKADSGEALPVLASIAFVLAASAVLPGIGTIAAIILLQKMHSNGRREKLRALEATDRGVIAPYLPKDDLGRYQREFGKEQVEKEMATAEELDALPVAILRQRQKEERKAARQAKVSSPPKSEPKPINLSAPPESPARVTESSLGVIVQNPKSTLFLAKPGAGKGVLLSNAVLGLKKARPEIFIYAIDPKDDPGERGFWESGAFDVVRHLDPLRDSGRFCRSLIAHLQEIQGLIKSGKSVLFILDESVIVAEHLKSGGDWGTEASQILESLSTWFVSGGASRQCFAWFVSQSPLDKALPFATYNRSQLRVAILLQEVSSLASLNSSNPPFVDKGLCRNELIEDAIDASHGIMEAGGRPPKSGRALYISDFSCWLPMIPLPVLSATDRDAGKFFKDSPVPTSPQSTPKSEASPQDETIEEESPFPEFDESKSESTGNEPEKILPIVSPDPKPVCEPEPALDFSLDFAEVKKAIKKLDLEWTTAAKIQDATPRKIWRKPDGTYLSRLDFRMTLDAMADDGRLTRKETAKQRWYRLG